MLQLVKVDKDGDASAKSRERKKRKRKKEEEMKDDLENERIERQYPARSRDAGEPNDRSHAASAQVLYSKAGTTILLTKMSKEETTC